MILIDNVKKDRGAFLKVADYLWGGFSGLATIALIIALWADYKNSEINITLVRSLVGVGTACAIGITLGLVAGAYRSFAAFLKPVITTLLSMPPIIWIVLAIFWFGFGNASTIFTIIITVLPLTFASSMVGMMSVSEDLKEMFDAYKLGI